MKEIQLHYIWERNLLPKHGLITTSGNRINILNRGVYNENEAGPDFVNACIQIDEIKWFGNVEIHIRSSDWFKHNHHNDDCYNNVILHVVYTDDLLSNSNTMDLPTLELSSIFSVKDIELLKSCKVLNKSILCGSQIHQIPSIKLTSFKQRMLLRRFNEKTRQFGQFSVSSDVLYYLLARAFGRQTNALSFELLCNKIPLNELLVMSAEERLNSILSKSGLNDPMENSDSFQIYWKQKGVRPSGFPVIRVKQFASFIANYDFDFFFLELSSYEIYIYLTELFEDSALLLDEMGLPPISREFMNSIIINAFVPFIFWIGNTKYHSIDIVEKAYGLLNRMPAEKNWISREWKKTSVQMSSAADTQSLQMIYNNFCRSKRCLDCEIGCSLVGNENHTKNSLLL